MRRHSLERAPRRVLRRRRGFSLELVPACESSARCLTDARRTRRFLGPRRSDRILQHETDARARPDGLPLLSRSGLAAPTSFMVTACAASCGEPCRSTWPPGCALSGSSSLRECFAGLHTSREARSEGFPSTHAADDRGATIYPQGSLARNQVTLTRRETLHGFRLQRHGPEVPSEGLARSTPLLQGCSVRVPLLEGLRTSSCHRSPARASWREIRPPTSTGQGHRLVRHPAKDGAFSTTRMFGSAPR